MAIPVFTTPAGRILSIEEEQTIVSDDNIDIQFTSDTDATIEIISGGLPDGAYFNEVSNGHYEILSSGITPISAETEYHFDIRVTNTDGQAERGFSILVTQITPQWLTDTRLFTVSELETIEHQFQLADPGGTAEFIKIAGSLPTAVTINDDGLLNGNVGTVTEDTVYEFTMRATSSEGTVIDKSFEIEVLQATDNQSPIWLTSSGSIGGINNNETSILQVSAFDPDGDPITYGLSSGSLPTGLILNTSTGEIEGVCNTSVQGVWPFSIQITDGTFLKTRNFTITTNENFDASITWVTDAGSLGTMTIGENSLLELEATSNYPIRYSISSGAMPQGLQLHPTNAAIYDDVQYQATGDYTFTVLAENDFVTAERQFSITVAAGYGEKAIRAYFSGPQTEIDEWRELTSHSLIDRENLFRPYDDRYGIQHLPKMLVFENMEEISPTQMKTRLTSNMLPLNLIIGDLQLAYARDNDGLVIYEVIYRRIYETVSQPLESFIHPQTQQTVLPAALGTFRNIFATDTPGLSGVSEESLPIWMTSEQTVGDSSSIPGYTPCFPVAYFKPDRGQEFYAEVIKEEDWDNRLKGVEISYTTINFETSVDDDLPQDFDVRFHSYLETQEKQELVAVNAPVWFTEPGAIAEVVDGESVSISLRADDPNGLPRTYSLNKGSFPNGLTMATNGVISGTVDDSESSYAHFTISADSSSGYSKTRSFQIKIN